MSEQKLARIKEIIVSASEKARRETGSEPEPELAKPLDWPIGCKVGPGLEGAIACGSKIGYIHGAKGWLIYRGYDIFDLCAHSTFEEVSYLLLHGTLPNESELTHYKQKLFNYSHANKTLRLLMGFPLEEMHVMAALRLGADLMRQEFTILDKVEGKPNTLDAIASDEDSIPMETRPEGTKHAIYEFRSGYSQGNVQRKTIIDEDASGLEACIQLIAGLPSIVGAIARILNKRLPLEPHPELSHAANLLYMLTGRKPSAVEERIMDICLILHADHGMNASTFAAMVVASTLSDIYFSVESGIGALSGPLHGGANEQVIHQLKEIGSVENVGPWLTQQLADKKKISGFGHRVYKAYDPRARVLEPLAELLITEKPDFRYLYEIAKELEDQFISRVGSQKKIFPNIDFYSGLVYSCLGIDERLFTPMFAVSRVAGWTSRVLEYIQDNRIFRPRALYTGEFNKSFTPLQER